MSRRLLRARRTARVWRLTARNGARFVWHRARRLSVRGEHREAMDARFTIRTSEDVARELGNMKGALMKFGQLLSFIMEALPDDAQQALSTLQADAPPMAPEAAEAVVRAELGAPPQKVFLDWQEEPVAAASVGQVHRAVTRDGRDVAVKVQYPGVGDAIETDLDNTEGLYRLVGAFALKGLDTKGLVDELRARMRDELDYRLEAANQREFAAHFAGHPFVRIPEVDTSTSTTRVLTTEWVPGMSFAQFLATATPQAKQHAGESIWRFVQHAVHILRAFNGDPHPGNYKFSAEGEVTFLDFGLVKRWTAGEWAQLQPTLEAMVVHRDPEMLMAAMEQVGFLRPGHGLPAELVYQYVSTPYLPYLTDRFRFTRDFVRDSMATVIDVKGPHAEVIERLNMPPSFVILDRVVWGVSAILGKLDVEAPWRGMLLEYLFDGAPATPLGEADRQWRRAQV
ncbi:MAG: AarF/ABC1/UbiB kinase family protein [Actinomycetota bacterium]|nr:AarF/ABC1/UbiB kinase family protein [Actinomycetota bacterium]